MHRDDRFVLERFLLASNLQLATARDENVLRIQFDIFLIEYDGT